MAGAATESGKKKVEVFETEEDLAVSLAKYAADLSAKFVEERGAFSVVLSGGSLIKSLRKLAEAPYIDSVDWSRWHVLWVDERVVPKDHDDSNYKLAYNGFLSKVCLFFSKGPSNFNVIYASPKCQGRVMRTCVDMLVPVIPLARSAEDTSRHLDCTECYNGM